MREFSVALLLASGVLKAQLKIISPWFPDVTLIGLCLVFFSYLTASYKRDIHWRYDQIAGVISFLILLSCIIFSAAYSNSQFASEKLIRFTVVIFAFAIGALSDIHWRKMTRYYLLFIFISTLIFLWVFPQFRLGLLGFEADFYRGAYLSFGDACAISVLMLVYFPLRSFWLSNTLIIFFLAALVISGARAPLIFLAVIVAMKMAFSVFITLRDNHSVNIGKPLLMAVIIFLNLVIGSLIFNTSLVSEIELSRVAGLSIDRFLLLFAPDKGGSVGVRVDHINDSIQAINEAPLLGVGLAGYGLEVMSVDRWAYPHNIFLEVWVESGLVAVLAIGTFLIIALMRVFRLSGFSFFAAILCYGIMNALKSSSYSDNRILFFWLGVALFHAIRTVNFNVAESDSRF